MKITTKPTSSPSRTEKPPPPLMLKFLRTNTIARSRGRSRSSPMFIRNKKNSSSIDTQSEPSSPKVTCIGQVRSSNPKSGRRIKPLAGFPCSCSWVKKNALFCTRFAKRLRPRSARRGWGTYRLFSPFGYCRSSRKSNAGSPEMESDQNEGDEEEEEDEDELRVKELAIEGPDCCSPPPRNALLLTRCRSAPYRSSSLAGRFWGQETVENRKGEAQTLERESSCGDSYLDLRKDRIIEGNLGRFGEIEEGSMIDDGIKKMETGEPGEGGGGRIGRGWVLTRCKSEPARSGERLKCL